MLLMIGLVDTMRKIIADIASTIMSVRMEWFATEAQP